jgi:hypothetical protein
MDWASYFIPENTAETRIPQVKEFCLDWRTFCLQQETHSVTSFGRRASHINDWRDEIKSLEGIQDKLESA